MKTFLQNIDINFRQLAGISFGFILGSLIIYTLWPAFGVLLLAMGIVGLGWCFMHK